MKVPLFGATGIIGYASYERRIVTRPGREEKQKTCPTTYRPFVDVLRTIEIAKQNRQGVVVSVRARDFLIDPLKKIAPVIQAGDEDRGSPDPPGHPEASSALHPKMQRSFPGVAFSLRAF